MSAIYSLSARSIHGEDILLERFRGKVLLIVNTASKCVFTPQYAGLQSLYEKYSEFGFEILGFPCNQFFKQEPGNAQNISEFCVSSYQVKFLILDKINVNGAHAHPLYLYLTQKKPGVFGTRAIKWNWTKFLIDSKGRPVRRYGPIIQPDAIKPDIEKLLHYY
ncbi:glutathione peroxidase [Candidatus Vallotia cooleyia]|uniref:glutathione peroxidase n=1 Tax=Candidatus Vallotiella adelgis TaxID=1177211 RepID=UPI001D007075|nr:glutathione peroxidase [Candidatus Vallotia cooleyia]UDG81913.1 Hydroperoxy fatty acid reductase gpx1 [Candidatus Vallotia cooleyia]